MKHLSLVWLLLFVAGSLSAGQTRKLVVTSTPTGASVIVNGLKIGQAPIETGIDTQTHMVELELNGHEPHAERIPAGGVAVYSVDAKLRPLRAPVWFTSKPEGATVAIDGSVIGSTPFCHETAVGRKAVTYSLAGFQDKTIPLEVVDSRPIALSCELGSLLGSLRVTTRPAGARILVDDELRGKSPLLLTDILEGRRRVQVTLAGYQPATKTVLVERGQVKELALPDLQALPGILKVESQPGGVDVYANDRLLGTTPFERRNLAPGLLVLRFSKTGFDDVVQEVSIEPGQTIKTIANLETVLGGIALATEPPGCQIYIDGKNLGTTQQQGNRLVSTIYELTELQEGPHILEVRRAGYAPVRKRILVLRGELNQLETVKLVKLWIPDHELHKTNGEVIKGVLVSKAPDGAIEFSPHKSVILRYTRNEYTALTPIEDVPK